MTIFEQINQIKLEDILRTVGIRYSIVGNTLNLFENGKPTDGWKADLNTGIVTDFANKRAYGDRLTFIMRLNQLDKGAAVNWYKETFHLDDEQKNELPATGVHQTNLLTNKPNNIEDYSEVKKKVFEKWNGLGNLNDTQINYLGSRGIDYSKVVSYIKNNNGYVSCALYDINGIISIQNRSVEEKKFMIEKGTNSKGCFMSAINKADKRVFVVEGMFDFLSLAQFGVNTIGLKSVHDGLDMVRAFYKKGYEVILIPDNDEAGQTVVINLADIKTSIFDLSGYEVKDINEFLVSSSYGEGIITVIEDERSREPTNIDLAFKKFEDIKSIFGKRGKLGIDGPFKNLDEVTQGIIEGKVYTIGGFSNVGKSQFSYEYVQHFIKQGKKVAYFSIEVDTGLLLGYVAKAYYKKDFNLILAGKEKINRNDFTNLFLYDNIKTLDGLIKTVELEKPDIVFIDFIQGFQCAAQGEYEKMTMLAGEIQSMAIRNNITVFSLSQVNNESRDKTGGQVMLKGSGALFQSSDVIFILFEESGDIKLTVAKNKFGKKGQEFFVKIDFNSGNIGVHKNSTGGFI